MNQSSSRGSEMTLFVLAPDGGVRRTTIGPYFPTLIESQGTVITYHDGAFYRIVPSATTSDQ